VRRKKGYHKKNGMHNFWFHHTLNRGEIEGIFMVVEKEKRVGDERSAHLTCFCKTEVVESKKRRGSLW